MKELLHIVGLDADDKNIIYPGRVIGALPEDVHDLPYLVRNSDMDPIISGRMAKVLEALLAVQYRYPDLPLEMFNGPLVQVTGDMAFAVESHEEFIDFLKWLSRSNRIKDYTDLCEDDRLTALLRLDNPDLTQWHIYEMVYWNSNEGGHFMVSI